MIYSKAAGQKAWEQMIVDRVERRRILKDRLIQRSRQAHDNGEDDIWADMIKEMN